MLINNNSIIKLIKFNNSANNNSFYIRHSTTFKNEFSKFKQQMNKNSAS